MDWGHLLSEGWQLVATGGLGVFVGSLVTNRLNHRATARQAALDRTSRALTSRRDRTYNDTKAAFMDAIALLVRLSHTTNAGDEEAPVESYASPAVVSALVARLSVFGSPEAAEVFRLAAGNYSTAWDGQRAAERAAEREREFLREHDLDRPIYQETLASMKEHRYRSANDSRDQYQAAEEYQEQLTALATGFLVDVEG